MNKKLKILLFCFSLIITLLTQNIFSHGGRGGWGWGYPGWGFGVYPGIYPYLYYANSEDRYRARQAEDDARYYAEKARDAERRAEKAEWELRMNSKKQVPITKTQNKF